MAEHVVVGDASVWFGGICIALTAWAGSLLMADTSIYAVDTDQPMIEALG